MMMMVVVVVENGEYNNIDELLIIFSTDAAMTFACW